MDHLLKFSNLAKDVGSCLFLYVTEFSGQDNLCIHLCQGSKSYMQIVAKFPGMLPGLTLSNI